MKKIYLAIPYSGMKDSSYDQATRATAMIISKGGYNVFSPITHSHPLTKYKDITIPGNWEYWEAVDYQYIDWCDEVWVLVPKEGFKKIATSVGVQAEIEYAGNQRKPVRYIQIVDGFIQTVMEFADKE